MAAPLTAVPTTIRIADDLRPVRTESSFRPTARNNTRHAAGGIYNPRSLSRSSVDRRLSFSRGAHDHRADAHSIGETEEGDHDWQANNVRTKQVFGGTTLLW